MNLETEIIDGYEVSAETKELWAVEIDLAEKLLSVCKKYGLRVWAAYGTMLGTVRHKGFIPWDDDMDFFLLRQDYNKLLEIAPSEFSNPYFFSEFFQGSMARLRRSDTTMIECGHEYDTSINQGIFIDILVYDGVPSDEDEEKKLYSRAYFIHRILDNYNYFCPNQNTSKLALLRHKLINLYLYFRGSVRLQQKFERIITQNEAEESEWIAPIGTGTTAWGRGINQYKKIKREWFSETIFMPFHDIYLPIPKEFDKVLTVFYGNYMIPIRSGVSKHTIIYVDCHRPYMEVIKENIKNRK